MLLVAGAVAIALPVLTGITSPPVTLQATARREFDLAIAADAERWAPREFAAAKASYEQSLAAMQREQQQ